MARPQMGQNAAARLLTSYSTMTRVTPVISYLHYIGFALGFLLRPLVFTYRRRLHALPRARLQALYHRLAAVKKPASGGTAGCCANRLVKLHKQLCRARKG